VNLKDSSVEIALRCGSRLEEHVPGATVERLELCRPPAKARGRLGFLGNAGYDRRIETFARTESAVVVADFAALSTIA